MKLVPGPLVVATHNAGKLSEIQALLEPRGFVVTSNADHGLGEPEETETTFAGNALIKARAAMEATGLVALADDSGMEVTALDGAPGVYTADWAETANGRDFNMAMEKVRAELADAEDWSARFCCTIAVAWPDGSEAVFEGHMPGHLVWPPRGAEGHGYDPMFQPEGHNRTFGEMQPEEKAALSHRSKALEALLEAVLA